MIEKGRDPFFPTYFHTLVLPHARKVIGEKPRGYHTQYEDHKVWYAKIWN